MATDYQPAPYEIVVPQAKFGRYRVEISQDLCWATIDINSRRYEALGSASPYWLDTHDDLGTMSTPLDRLLEMIRTGRDPDKLSKDDRAGYSAWLYADGRPLIAGWRKAHALAKHFCDHPHDLRGALKDELARRWGCEKSPRRELLLRSFIPKEDREKMGVMEPTPLRDRGVLEVPF